MAKKLDPLTTCIHLRSKEMFYQTEGTRDEDHDRDVERLYGACDTRAFWCQCTQTGRGPDDRIVGREECTRPGRACFVGIASLA